MLHHDHVDDSDTIDEEEDQVNNDPKVGLL